MRARDLMQADPITIPSDMPFLQIQHLFVVAKISGAPVVEPCGTVLGVISNSDLLRVGDQICDEDVDPEDSGELAAREIVTPELVWVEPETPIDRVARLMLTRGIHRVLVGKHGRLEGIVTTFDLLRALDRSSVGEVLG